MTYLLTDLSPGLLGLGGALLALFCDSASPRTFALDLERSSTATALRGVSITYSSTTVALQGVSVAGTDTALHNFASSSSSSMFMVSTSRLTVVVSTDTMGPALSLFLFASAA